MCERAPRTFWPDLRLASAFPLWFWGSWSTGVPRSCSAIPLVFPWYPLSACSCLVAEMLSAEINLSHRVILLIGKKDRETCFLKTIILMKFMWFHYMINCVYFKMRSLIIQKENLRRHINLKDVKMWAGGSNRYETNKINCSTIFDKECIYVYVLHSLKSSPYRLYNSNYQYVDTWNCTIVITDDDIHVQWG